MVKDHPASAAYSLPSSVLSGTVATAGSLHLAQGLQGSGADSSSVHERCAAVLMLWG